MNGEWQPIETAPKDRPIILWLGEPWGKVAYVKWCDLWGCWHHAEDPEPELCDELWGIGSGIPTHWMPLPDPPKQE